MDVNKSAKVYDWYVALGKFKNSQRLSADST